MTVGIIGAGSWGTAVAWLLGSKGIDVRMWARRDEVARSICEQHRNPSYLSEVVLPDSVTATTDMADALRGCESVVMVTPSSYVRATAEDMKPHLEATTPVIILSKGVEAHTGLVMTDILGDVLGNHARIAALAGPNHAEEVSRGIPAATVIASDSAQTAEYFQTLFSTPAFRAYTSRDVIGVELCAAAKNIIAIAVGIVVGSGYGDNTAALFMTRGLAEISRLVVAMGGEAITCLGLAGVGDLVATCTSQHSRNRRFGELIAAGGSLEDFGAQTHMVAEGAYACKTVLALAESKGVEMPIATMVRAMVWEGRSLDAVSDALTSRPLKEEFYGI